MNKLKSILMGVLILAVICPAQKPGDIAPLFEAGTLDGKTVKLEELKGKVIILDFWASWCVICREAFPAMAKLNKKINSGSLEFLAVNIDTDPKNAKRYMADTDLDSSFTVILDPELELPPKYDLQGLPASVFIDARGIIRYKHSGFEKSHLEKYEKELRGLLSEVHEESE